MMSDAARRPPQAETLPWLILAAGLACLYVPTLIDLLHGAWTSEQQGQGPLVLGLAVWMLWRNWPKIEAPGPQAGRPRAAALLFVFGGLAYVVGRTQGFWVFEVGSVIPMLAGCLLTMRGPAAVRAAWFPLLFMVFMIPYPATLVDALTQPMKISVSYVAEHILYALGYPIARTGVIIQIGQYQLLVADACAGLNTLFTLEAMGLMYLNVVRHSSWTRNVGLAILIVPISFIANVIRVIALTLITYYYGDDAGQGFLHGFAGLVLFVSALLLIIATDSLLRFAPRGSDEGGRAVAR
jgi:exosortase B